jgi:hypothetical protein
MMFDLGILAILPDDVGDMASIRHYCGCRAYWWVKPGDWVVATDSPWRVCPDHQVALRGVSRPCDCGPGYPWVHPGQ